MNNDLRGKANRQMVEQLKQTVFGKLPIAVILFSATFVDGRFKERIAQAVDYIHKVIRTGNEASKILFGITAEIIQEGNINALFGGKPPDMDELGEIVAQCLDGLLGAIEAGVFVRKDIEELMGHLRQLAYTVILPESSEPDENERVKFALSVVEKMGAAISEENEPENQGLVESLSSYLDVALNDGVASLKNGDDPIIPFAMTWNDAEKQSIQRCLADDYEKGVQMARDHVSRKCNGMAVYCIVWSGYVTIEGQRTDALLIEAARRGGAKAVLMAMCYKPTAENAPFEETGSVRLLEYRDNLL